MENIQSYVIVSAYRRAPSIKDILRALHNPQTKKYSQLQDAVIDFSKIFFDDEVYGLFGINTTGSKIYSFQGTIPIIEYCRTTSILNANAQSGFGSIFWTKRQESYIQIYNKNGYYLESMSRLGFIPNNSITIKNECGKATLYSDQCYPIDKTIQSVGNLFFVSTSNNTFYKAPSFWKKNGTIIENWHNEDAEFDASGRLVRLLESH